MQQPNQEQSFDSYVQKKEGVSPSAFAMFRPGSPVLSKLELTLRSTGTANSFIIMRESGAIATEIASWIHAHRFRGQTRFCRIPCSGFPEGTLEGWIFGNGSTVGGAWAWVNGGTLYLENADRLPERLQEKLVMWFGGGTPTADRRPTLILSVTSSAGQGADQSRLASLHSCYLSVSPNEMEPSEKASVAKLAAVDAFRRAGKAFPGFRPDAVEMLKSYSWSHGVTELMNLCERASLKSDGSQAVSASDLGLAVPGVMPLSNGAKLELVYSASASTDETPSDSGGVDSPFSQTVSQLTPQEGECYTDVKKRWTDAFEKDYLVFSLKKHHGNVSSAAREAKLDRSNFLRLLRRHALRAEDFRAKKQISVGAA